MKKAKKVLALFLAAVMLVCTTVAATVAYLYSKTEVTTNTFTVGDVKIILNEADNGADEEFFATVDGKEVAIETLDVEYKHGEEDRDTRNGYHLLPNTTHAKDPMVSVRKDSEDSYIRMLVTVQNYDRLVAAFPDEYTVDGVFLLQNVVDWNEEPWAYFDCTINGTTAIYEFRYNGVYTVAEDAATVTVTGGKTGDAGEYVELVPLFTEITIPGSLVNEDIALLSTVAIDVEAHAIQAEGFGTAEEAWAAFDAEGYNA